MNSFYQILVDRNIEDCILPEIKPKAYKFGEMKA